MHNVIREWLGRSAGGRGSKVRRWCRDFVFWSVRKANERQAGKWRPFITSVTWLGPEHLGTTNWTLDFEKLCDFYWYLRRDCVSIVFMLVYINSTCFSSPTCLLFAWRLQSASHATCQRTWSYFLLLCWRYLYPGGKKIIFPSLRAVTFKAWCWKCMQREAAVLKNCRQLLILADTTSFFFFF